MKFKIVIVVITDWMKKKEKILNDDDAIEKL
jgi:hypothetical protein